jgi:hypothetical protein
MAQLDVTPTLPENDLADGRMTHPKFGRELLLRDAASRVPNSDEAHCFGAQLGSGALFAGESGATPLGSHVADVVEGCPQKEMVWANARRIVAVMAHMHPGGDGAVVQFPRKAMRTGIQAIMEKQAVSVSAEVALPLPAAFALLHFSPEPSFGADSTELCRTVDAQSSQVHGAQATRLPGLFAAINRTVRLALHRVTSGVARQGVSAPLPLSIVPKGADAWGF